MNEALTDCAACGHQISKQAASCPNCGHPNDAVTAEAIATSPAAAKNKKSGWMPALLATLMIIGLYVFVVSLDPPSMDAPTVITSKTTPPTAAMPKSAKPSSTGIPLNAKLCKLRDQAIQNIGWVAGNSYDHPIWPEMEQYVGRGGVYYDTYVSLKCGLHRDEATTALANVQLYRDWFEKGRKKSFNEPDNMRRIKRVIQINDELRADLKNK